MNLLVYLHRPELAATVAGHLSAVEAGVHVQVATVHDEAVSRAPEVDILTCFGPEVRTGFFERATRLKWVQALGTGTDGIRDNPGRAPGVIVTATRGIHAAPVSELAILFMLAFSRDVRRMERQRRERHWQQWPGVTLAGKTAGILGLGAIAEGMAPRFKALGMTVIGVSNSPRPVEGCDEVHPRSALLDVVGRLDFLVLLLPLDASSQHIVGAEVLRAMKPTAFLLNLARGGVLDEEALLRALDGKRLAGAALDAHGQEPLPPGSPFWGRDDVYLTPHVGGLYDGYGLDAARQVEANLRLFLEGRIDGMRYRVA